MAIKYPYVIVITFFIVLVLVILKFVKRKDSFSSGVKSANTRFIKENEYYKKRLKKLKTIVVSVKVLIVASIVVCAFLMARLITIETIRGEKYNRDIFLCMDVSTSVNDLNLKLIDKFREVVRNVDNDRVGIIIFNTYPVVYSPLTDDYKFVLSKLDEIEAVIKETDQEIFDSYYELGVVPVSSYDRRGSSLIGDGLAATVYDFTDIEEDKNRTRIIIFSTDNDLLGSPYYTLDEAAKLCKNKNIYLYGIAPETSEAALFYERKVEEFKNAVENIAGGKFYYGENDSTSTNLINDIESTKKSRLRTSRQTKDIDHPELLFIVLFLLVSSFVVVDRRFEI